MSRRSDVEFVIAEGWIPQIRLNTPKVRWKVGLKRNN